MRWPAVLLTPRRRAAALLVGAELVLVLAIPFLAIGGYHALLDSHAGQLVKQPTEAEPGWRALVDPSPLAAVVETDGGEITGIALLAGHVERASGGTVILVPGTLQVEGRSLASRPAEEAVQALGQVLRLRFTSIDVVGPERWSSVLGSSSYRVSNPDPVVDEAGRPELPVGPTTVDAANAARFLGRPAPGSDPVTLLYRRGLLWSELVADPPATGDPLVERIAGVSGPAAQVVILPLVAVEADPSPDLVATEALIREVVPVPAGPAPGDRLQVRIVDRTGLADLPAIAAEVASTGSEVVEIGNAAAFDGGPTQLVVPAGIDDPDVTALAMLTGATTVQGKGVDSDPVVTLVVGTDFAGSRP